jgi:RNA polymerase sigma factor (sigma-70 family)
MLWQTTHITLLQRLSGGTDQGQAWRDFHARYADLILGFCRAKGVQHADAEDVLQDVLLSVSKAMPGFTYDPAKGRFRSYLRTATLHAISRRSRQNHSAVALETVEPVADAGSNESDEHWEVQWRRYHLRRALRRLEDEVAARDIEAFDRYAIMGEHGPQVCADLGLTMDNLYQIKSRLLKRISSFIHEQVGEEG